MDDLNLIDGVASGGGKGGFSRLYDKPFGATASLRVEVENGVS